MQAATATSIASRWSPSALVPADFQDSESPPYELPAQAPLHLRILRTAREREQLAGLRKYAPMGVEDDLGAGLMPYEAMRDEVGVVTAMYRGSELVGTLRFVPSGLDLTAAERLAGGIGDAATKILGAGSWEIGRLIVAPDERSPEVLTQCLTLALEALMEEREVERFYAIATPVMARLWRRWGMRPVAPLRGASGREFLLVSGLMSAAAAALDVPVVLPQMLATPQPMRHERMALSA
ncbi:MAG TPA: hypothetical protein VHL79_11260 [Ramlibacter sp.]|nr:hypothetical protein [Ramlibacter sp.]